MYSNLFITYGSEKNFLVITKKFIKHFVKNTSIHIIANYNFNNLFTDPSINNVKKIIIYYNGNKLYEIPEVIINDVILELPLDCFKSINHITKPIYIYYHICIIGDRWPSIINNTIKYIKKSGLYDKITQIKCFILGQLNINRVKSLIDPKILLVESHLDVKKYEKYTLNHLWDDCQQNNFDVLYLHTKGVVGISTKNKIDWNWINEMLYCNCYNHNKITKLLVNYDTVGTRYTNKSIGPHYSGNFWWSKSEYIKHLNRNIGNKYLDPEAWLLKNIKNNKHINIIKNGRIEIIDNSNPKQIKPVNSNPKQIKPENSNPKQIKPENSNPKQIKPENSNPKQIKPENSNPKQIKPENSNPKQIKPKPKNIKRRRIYKSILRQYNTNSQSKNNISSQTENSTEIINTSNINSEVFIPKNIKRSGIYKSRLRQYNTNSQRKNNISSQTENSKEIIDTSNINSELFIPKNIQRRGIYSQSKNNISSHTGKSSRRKPYTSRNRRSNSINSIIN